MELHHERRGRRRRLKKGYRIALICLAAAAVLGAGLLWWAFLRTPAGVEDTPGYGVEIPAWVEQDLLPLNQWSRPGRPLYEVNAVVVHYVGNPGTTAQNNRDYFANLSLTHDTYASSHFVVGLEGEILQCLKGVFHLHGAGETVAYSGAEGLLQLLFYNKDNGFKACPPGVKQGKVDDLFPAGPHRVDLLQSTITAAHAGSHNDQYGFAHNDPPFLCF